MAEYKLSAKNTKCWTCRNSIPCKNFGCSWSREFKPISGWKADKVTVKMDKKVYPTYLVHTCPEYILDVRPETYGDYADYSGYVRLATMIVESQFSAYRDALDAYRKTGSRSQLGVIRSMEGQILTDYYAALTMRAVDLKDVLNEERAKRGMPPIEEICTDLWEVE